MKISKLFHWLYACLLLLPIACFLPNAFYYGFNAQAQASERIEQQPVYYPTNEVNNVSDLSVNHIYKWNDDYTPSVFPSSNQLLFYIKNTENLPFIDINKEVNYIRIYYLSDGRLSAYVRYVDNSESWNTLSAITIDFVIDSYGVDFQYTNNVITHISESTMLIIEDYLPITYTNSITDSMSVAWQQTWSNPLFSWAEYSFLVAPFNYITNLFGVPNNSTFSIALSYWCAISIIWLVFDLFMYVPLLAHRWIDKAKIE